LEELWENGKKKGKQRLKTGKKGDVETDGWPLGLLRKTKIKYPGGREVFHPQPTTSSPPSGSNRKKPRKVILEKKIGGKYGICREPFAYLGFFQVQARDKQVVKRSRDRVGRRSETTKRVIHGVNESRNTFKKGGTSPFKQSHFILLLARSSGGKQTYGNERGN